MSAGDYLEGAIVFALVLGGSAVGAALLQQRRLGHLRGAPRLLALALLITLGVLAVHMVPAMLGLLSRGAVLAATALWALGASLVPAARSSPAPEQPPIPAERRVALGLAAVGAVFTAVFVTAMLLDQATLAPGSVDILNFHLPGIGEWIQTGSIWGVHNFLPDVSPGNYPNSGDVILLAAVLPWRSDFLSHLAIYPFLALTSVGIYALAAELRAPRSASVLAGCLALTLPVVAIPALVHGFPDAVLLFAFSTGIVFLIRHHRGGATCELVLAGLALGLAFGTKWYGVSSVAVVVAVWAVASLAAGRRLGAVARQGAALVGLIALVGGVWLLRNWIESGNPFFPVKVDPLGVTIFDAPRDVVRELGGFTIADYLGDPDAWREFILPQYRDALAAPGALLIAGVVAAAALLAAGWRRVEQRGLVAALLGCTVVLAVAYSITPYTAGGLEGEPVLVGADSRYLIPALVVSAALLAWTTRAAGWAPVGLGVVALPALVDGARLSSDGTNSGAVLEADRWLIAAALTAALAGLAWAAWWAWSRLSPRVRPAAVAGAAAVALAGAALVGNEVQERFHAHRYLRLDPTVDHLLLRAPTDNHIGLAGSWDDQAVAPPLPAFGPRYGNEVDYVGEYIDETLRRYSSRDRFVAALTAGGYDYLFVGRGRPPQPVVSEERWARAAGYEQVARSPRLTLFRAPG